MQQPAIKTEKKVIKNTNVKKSGDVSKVKYIKICFISFKSAFLTDTCSCTASRTTVEIKMTTNKGSCELIAKHLARI